MVFTEFQIHSFFLSFFLIFTYGCVGDVLTCVDIYEVLHAEVGQATADTVSGPHHWLRKTHTHTHTRTHNEVFKLFVLLSAEIFSPFHLVKTFTCSFG